MRTKSHPPTAATPEELAKIRVDNRLIKPTTRLAHNAVPSSASHRPKGSILNNERLAKGVRLQLARIRRGLYSFDADVMHTSWVAENWEGYATTWRHAAIPIYSPRVSGDTSLAPGVRE